MAVKSVEGVVQELGERCMSPKKVEMVRAVVDLMQKREARGESPHDFSTFIVALRAVYEACRKQR